MKYKLIKTVSCLLIFAFLTNIFPITKNISAASQFSVSLDYIFSFEENGNANVTQKVTSTNLTEDFYASEYSIKVHNNSVSNISGSDGLGSIKVTSKSEGDSTIINAKLNQQIVGLKKSVTFKIKYSTDSFAIKRGKIWDISIPQIETSEDVTAYQVTLSVPDSFGKLGKIVPEPTSERNENARKIFTFSKNVLINSRIGAAFGDFQQFKFKVKYRYKNDKIYTVKATIALPPDTEYQALFYKTLDPKPILMRTDGDGNYLADYLIKPGKNLEVIASGEVKIIDAVSPFQRPIIWKDSDLKRYTKNDKYIESNNSQIQKKAKELKNIKEIYDFVTSTLKYDYTRLETKSYKRRGAVAALNQPDKSICVDYADLFVALARAKGIAARGLVGFGYSDDSNLRPTKVEGLVNSNLLHAWAEYYDKTKKRWIQVDPTWGSTTGGVDYFNRLDTNHFVFVINGSSSTLPIPAGGYKTSENQIDDVDVKFSNDKLSDVNLPKINLSGKELISGFPTDLKLTLENTSGRAFFNTKFEVKSGNILRLIKPNKVEIGILLPFAKNTYDIKLRSDSLFDNNSEKVGVKLTTTSENKVITKEFSKNIFVKPFFSFQIPQLILLVLFLTTIVSWIYHIVISRRLSKQQ